jgi:hypothetical protein
MLKSDTLMGGKSTIIRSTTYGPVAPVNVRCGNTLRRAGIGRLTRQYNPASAGATSAREGFYGRARERHAKALGRTKSTRA